MRKAQPINHPDTDHDSDKLRRENPDIPSPDVFNGQLPTAMLLQRAKNTPDSLKPRQILQLQSTIGNQAVGRLLAAHSDSVADEAKQQGTKDKPDVLRTSHPPVLQTRRKSKLIQRAVALPNVGTFDTKIYQPHDRAYDAVNGSQNPVEQTDREVGAKILIEFRPDGQFELANGNRISLVQTVRETIAKKIKMSGQLGDENVDTLRENFTAGFSSRTVTDDDEDSGWAIDHQLFKEDKGVRPDPQAQQAAIASYSTARANALVQLANFPNELALVQNTPDPLQFAGVRQVSNFKANIHKPALQRVISRLRGSDSTEAKEAVEAVRSMIQYEYATRNKITLRNLDPRYAEERTDVNDPLKARPQGNLDTLKNPTGDPNQPQSQGGGDLLLGHTFNATCDGNNWTTAALSDEPTVPFKTRDAISGGMEFEVAALLEKPNGDQRYIGSVKWGWQVVNNAVVLEPAVLTLADGKNASPAFFKASEAWNNMSVPDPSNGNQVAPVLNLPTASPEYTKHKQALQVALKGSDKKLMTSERDDMLDMWKKLSKDDKEQAKDEVIGLLDQYEMKVNARRPSQDALVDQYDL
jgi:hypothetical protein